MKHRFIGVLAILIIVTISYIDRINVSVLDIEHSFLVHFGLVGNRAGQGALMTFFLLGYGLSAIFLTLFYESKLGYKKGFLVSLFFWGILTVISPLLGSFMALIMVRALLGVSEGPLFSLKVMYVNEHYAPNERGKPNAISSMGVSLGLAIGYPFISFLLVNYGWHSSFYVLGFLNIAVGIPLVLLFIEENKTFISKSKPAIQLLKEAITVNKIWAILLIEIFTLSYLWGSSTWLPSYLTQDKNFSIGQMGVIASLPFIISICANMLGGILVDKIPQSKTGLIFTCSASCCALSVFILINTHSILTTLIFLLLASFFWGLQSAAIPTLVQRFSPAECVGSAYGFINGVGNIIASLMPFLMGSMMKKTIAAGFILLIASQLLSAICGLLFIKSNNSCSHQENC